MGEELLITASPYGMLAAAVAGGRPVAFFVEWTASPSCIGDVHVARLLGRMSGIDACIVDIGDGEEAFLQGARGLDADGAPPVVQVVCDALEGKRARVTRKPALAGRTAVFRPGGSGLAFSRRLRDPQIKRALGAALDGMGAPGGALTIRGAAAASPDAVPAEVRHVGRALGRDRGGGAARPDAPAPLARGRAARPPVARRGVGRDRVHHHR